MLSVSILQNESWCTLYTLKYVWKCFKITLEKLFFFFLVKCSFIKWNRLHSCNLIFLFCFSPRTWLYMFIADFFSSFFFLWVTFFKSFIVLRLNLTDFLFFCVQTITYCITLRLVKVMNRSCDMIKCFNMDGKFKLVKKSSHPYTYWLFTISETHTLHSHILGCTLLYTICVY